MSFILFIHPLNKEGGEETCKKKKGGEEQVEEDKKCYCLVTIIIDPLNCSVDCFRNFQDFGQINTE